MREVNVGERLDQYELIELIARSGMASIFKARDTLDGAAVAIKVPYMQFERDVVFHNRFEREEAVGKRLSHPKIIRVLTPQRKSRMYIAMEYVEGVSLRAIMRESPKMAPARALGLAQQLGEALEYMHGQGVIHRDLKPENILVTADGEIKIMDFGIAFEKSARRLTWSGLSSTLGTPDYMAPEQVSGRHADSRTDIYALGTILYEMLTAELPYSSESVYNIMRAKETEDPQPPRHYRPDLDQQLEEIILHAIEREPRDRYASAAELLADLRDPSKVVVRGRAAQLRPRNLSWIRFKRGVWVTALFGSLIGLFIFLVWLANRPPAASMQPRSLERKVK
ncbi:MAG: serine/threonine-protein kinase [Candidatus Binataceae bacterium]